MRMRKNAAGMMNVLIVASYQPAGHLQPLHAEGEVVALDRWVARWLVDRGYAKLVPQRKDPAK
jgi:hypothetical protein